MKKILMVITVVALLGGYFLINNRGDAATPETTAQTTLVEEKNIESIIYVNGKVINEATRNLKPNTNAVVDKIRVRIGDEIKAGDVVAEMNIDDLRYELKSKTIQLEIEKVKLAKLDKGSDIALVNALKTATVSFEAAEKKKSNNKMLLDAGAISENDYQTSVIEYENAKALYENANYNATSSNRMHDLLLQRKSVESIENDIENLNKKIGKASVKAPINGVITDISAVEGEGSASNIMVISDFSKNIIKANISEVDINKVKIGQAVKITANSARGESYDGKVSFIAPGSKNVEGKKQAYVEIKVSLDKVVPELRANFTVNMQIVTDSKVNVKSVSSAAINTRKNGEEYVLVRNTDGTTKEVTIKTGITNDVDIEILEGQVNVGDTIEIKQSEVQEESLGLF